MGKAQHQVHPADDIASGLNKSLCGVPCPCGSWYRIETDGITLINVAKSGTKSGTNVVVKAENDLDPDSRPASTSIFLLPSMCSSHSHKLKDVLSKPEQIHQASSTTTCLKSNTSSTEKNNEASSSMDLQSLGAQPTKQAVDSWIANFRARCRQRGENLRCPACSGIQRRPSALKNHLYFRYRIEPYECSKGCGFTLSTLANMKRHAQKCNGIPPHREEWVPSCRPSPRNKET